MSDVVNLLEIKIRPETWEAIFNTKAKHIDRGVVPNWLFFSTKFIKEYPELQYVKEMSGMSVHVCDLPAGYDLMMVHLNNKDSEFTTKGEEHEREE